MHNNSAFFQLNAMRNVFYTNIIANHWERSHKRQWALIQVNNICVSEGTDSENPMFSHQRNCY